MVVQAKMNIRLVDCFDVRSAKRDFLSGNDATTKEFFGRSDNIQESARTKARGKDEKSTMTEYNIKLW